MRNVKTQLDAAVMEMKTQLATLAAKEQLDAAMRNVKVQLDAVAKKEHLDAAVAAINGQLATIVTNEQLHAAMENIKVQFNAVAKKEQLDALVEPVGELRRWLGDELRKVAADLSLYKDWIRRLLDRPARFTVFVGDHDNAIVPVTLPTQGHAPSGVN
jgi:hypothetical protein